MHLVETRNHYFDELFNNPALMWLGQNTNHFDTPPQVGQPIYDPTQGYRLTVAQLEAAVTGRTRLIYLVDPNNPLGVCYTAEEIKAFTRIARRVGAYFVHDCTYFHFADNHTRAATFYPEKS